MLQLKCNQLDQLKCNHCLSLLNQSKDTRFQAIVRKNEHVLPCCNRQQCCVFHTKPKERRWLDYDFEKKLEEASPVKPVPMKGNVKCGVLPSSVPG